MSTLSALFHSIRKDLDVLLQILLGMLVAILVTVFLYVHLKPSRHLRQHASYVGTQANRGLARLYCGTKVFLI